MAELSSKQCPLIHNAGLQGFTFLDRNENCFYDKDDQLIEIPSSLNSGEGLFIRPISPKDNKVKKFMEILEISKLRGLYIPAAVRYFSDMNTFPGKINNRLFQSFETSLSYTKKEIQEHNSKSRLKIGNHFDQQANALRVKMITKVLIDSSILNYEENNSVNKSYSPPPPLQQLNSILAWSSDIEKIIDALPYKYPKKEEFRSKLSEKRRNLADKMIILAEELAKKASDKKALEIYPNFIRDLSDMHSALLMLIQNNKYFSSDQLSSLNQLASLLKSRYDSFFSPQ